MKINFRCLGRIAGLAAMASGLAGCDEIFKASPIVNDRTYVFDAVKAIGKGDADSFDDSARFARGRYVISPDDRLLMRFEGILDVEGSFLVNDGARVEVTVVMTDEANEAAAQGALRLCSVERSWMMLASWQSAHPFGSSGRWSVPGGDYRPSDCVSATAPASGGLVFDVTNWFLYDVRSRRANQGLVLVAESGAHEVYGDGDRLRAPRIHWQEIVR